MWCSIIVFLILLIPSVSMAADCRRLERLRVEWAQLEEKTSGGVFFSGPSEATRLNTLRRVMSLPGSITINCRRKNNESLDHGYESVQSVP